MMVPRQDSTAKAVSVSTVDHNTPHHNCKVLIHLRPSVYLFLTLKHKSYARSLERKKPTHDMLCSVLTVAVNGCDIITAVVEVVALHITVAA